MSRVWPYAALLVLGAGWGLTIPLVQVATAEARGHFGLIFWHFAAGTVVLGLVQALRRRPLPLNRRTLTFGLMIAVLGTLLPNTASYRAAAELPGGIMAIVVSSVPMFAFPIALLLGMDRFSALRLSGLALGLLGVALVALPGTAPPGTLAALWVPVALIAPLCYALEGNVVARWGTAGLGPIQLLLLASAIGTVLALPLAMASGQVFLPRPLARPDDAAILGVGVLHALVYASYVWLIGRTGSVFAAQVAYLVTGFGVLWSMAYLGERYPATVWLALALVLAGIALVQPRRRTALAPPAPPVQAALRTDDGTK